MEMRKRGRRPGGGPKVWRLPGGKPDAPPLSRIRKISIAGGCVRARRLALIRAELTPTQRAVAVARRREDSDLLARGRRARFAVFLAVHRVGQAAQVAQ